MVVFSMRLNPAMEVNCQLLKNEYSEISCFSVVLNRVINLSMLNKYGPVLSVEQETIIENVNLASNRDYNHGTVLL